MKSSGEPAYGIYHSFDPRGSRRVCIQTCPLDLLPEEWMIPYAVRRMLYCLYSDMFLCGFQRMPDYGF